MRTEGDQSNAEEALQLAGNRVNNVALVPGNLLPYKQQWQELANRLPYHAVLIVLPTTSPSGKRTLLSVAKLLSQAGRQVRVVSSGEVSSHASTSATLPGI
jgi:hypothetical protein